MEWYQFHEMNLFIDMYPFTAASAFAISERLQDFLSQGLLCEAAIQIVNIRITLRASALENGDDGVHVRDDVV